MKKIILALALLFTVTAQASAPQIWQSTQYGKYLTTLGFKFFDDKIVRTLTVDPSAGAGIVAPIGSFGLRNNGGSGELWLKTAAGNTAWTNVSGGASGWGLTGNAGTNPALNFLGTTDGQDLVFRTNSTERFRIRSTGELDSTFGYGVIKSDGAGVLNPSVILDVDVAVTAGINRQKLMSGTPNQVVINDAFGGMTSEPNLAISRGGTNSGTALGGFNNLSPLATKGDLLSHDGTNNVRVLVGPDGYSLVADSTTTTGVRWVTQTASSLTVDNPQSIGIANNVGVSTAAARADHVHQGVHSVTSNGGAQIYGDVNFLQGSGITLAQSGQNITITATPNSSTAVVEQYLSGGITYADPIDPPTVAEGATSLSQVRLAADNSGDTGSIQVIITQNEPGDPSWKTSSAFLTANGKTNTVLYNLNPTFTAVSGDRFRASVSGLPYTGHPSDLSVKFLFY